MEPKELAAMAGNNPSILFLNIYKIQALQTQISDPLALLLSTKILKISKLVKLVNDLVQLKAELEHLVKAISIWEASHKELIGYWESAESGMHGVSWIHTKSEIQKANDLLAEISKALELVQSWHAEVIEGD